MISVAVRYELDVLDQFKVFLSIYMYIVEFTIFLVREDNVFN